VIAIATEAGSLLKILPSPEAGNVGFHSLFGFISEAAFGSRVHRRRAKGLRAGDDWAFKFKISPQGVEAVQGCKVTKQGNAWQIASDAGNFLVSQVASPAEVPAGARTAKPAKEPSETFWKVTAAVAVVLLLLLFLLPNHQEEVAPPPVAEPIEVKIVKEVQKPVAVPEFQATASKVVQQIQDQKVRRAVEQNLGFLGVLGRKDLTKVLGGAPTQLKDASPGAGAGGNQGSGGELLVGLGEGVKRTTVGNTGVAGLGGIGSKGAGGGAGGYGTTSIGSGEGRSLSTVPLSKDMILEGGLDRSVIQATIAKYLSQVRACYEDGLRRNPGLEGVVAMDFQINASGRLNYSRVARSSLGSPQVEHCISARMMTWEFPKPLGGVDVKVNYPFLLRPVGT